MTPKDAQITLKAHIFFFSFHKFGFREKKKKSARKPENMVFGSKQSSNVKLTFVLAILCKIKFTDKLAASSKIGVEMVEITQ